MSRQRAFAMLVLVFTLVCCIGSSFNDAAPEWAQRIGAFLGGMALVWGWSMKADAEIRWEKRRRKFADRKAQFEYQD